MCVSVIYIRVVNYLDFSMLEMLILILIDINRLFFAIPDYFPHTEYEIFFITWCNSVYALSFFTPDEDKIY